MVLVGSHYYFIRENQNELINSDVVDMIDVYYSALGNYISFKSKFEHLVCVWTYIRTYIYFICYFYLLCVPIYELIFLDVYLCFFFFLFSQIDHISF